MTEGTFDPGPVGAYRRWTAAFVAAVQGLRGRRSGWMATAFGTGTGLYFALPVEPAPNVAMGLALACAAGVTVAIRRRDDIGPLALIAAALVAGLIGAQLRANLVAAPVLGFRYYGAVEGRVVVVDRSTSGRPRVTLDRVRLDRVPGGRTPARVRLSLHSDLGLADPMPGDRVMTTANLMPPSGPVEPGGFDFQRHAWFDRLGAVGYARVPLLRAAPDRDGGRLARWRARLSAHLRASLPGDAGAVAAAIVTGDRSAIDPDVTATLRDSNLAHLLAISGLHMGLLVGIVMGTVRIALAAVPAVALSHPVRVWAATAAVPVACAYLAISGGSVATQRAFVMALVMLGAVILGRRALSLRSLAIAALIVLILRPEAIVGPGFQMSFAATGALIVAFDRLARGDGWWRRGLAGAAVALVASSVIAGLATAPFAAAHFNRFGQFGLLANVLAVPAMGSWVMPLLFAGLILEPVGLGGVPIRMAGWGIDWILAVARVVAGLDGAVVGVPAPPPHVVPIVGLAFAVFGCTRRAGRTAAVAAALAAGLSWALHDRPDVLIAPSGGLVGVLGPEGRWLSRETGEGFAADAWLENDGDMASRPAASARPVPHPGGPLLVAVRGVRQTEAALSGECEADVLIVTDQAVEPVARPCGVVDATRLRRTGALALFVARRSVRTVAAADLQGRRPWTGHGLLTPSSVARRDQ